MKNSKPIFKVLDWHQVSDSIDYLSDKTVLGSDIVIWDQTGTYSGIKSKFPLQHGTRYAQSHNVVALSEKIESRKNELRSHLQAGKLLVLILDTPLSLTSNIQSNVFATFSESLPAGLGLKMKSAEGKGGFFIKSDTFSELTSLFENARYKVSFAPDRFTVLGHIKDHPTEAIAAYQKIAGGHVLLVPSVHTSESVKFVSTLANIYEKLTKERVIESLPGWTSKFQFSTEALINNEIDKIESQIRECVDAIKALKSKSQVYETYRHLLSSKGEDLRLAVADIFKKLNFEISDKDEKKEDLVAKYGEQVAAIEVKGKKGSSGSTDRRQLDDWVSSYALRNDADPKGILVVNGFNETPVLERKEPVFPDEMIPQSISRNYCLLTTAQLLTEYLAVKDGLITERDLIEKIFNTAGIYKSDFTLERWLKF